MKEIEKKIGKTFEYKKVPTPEHIIEKQLYNLADRIERVQVDEEAISKYIPGVRKKLEWLSEEDLLKRVLSLEFNRLLNYYRDMPNLDLDAPEQGSGKEKKRGERREKRDKDRRVGEPGYDRIMLNVGKSDGFFPGNLMEIINRNTDGTKPEIGRIDLLPDYTLFDVRKGEAKKVLDALKNVDFFGTTLRPEMATERDYSRKKNKKGTTKDKKGSSEISKKKPSSAKKERNPKSSKKEYNGNYEIFYKKKK